MLEANSSLGGMYNADDGIMKVVYLKNAEATVFSYKYQHKLHPDAPACTRFEPCLRLYQSYPAEPPVPTGFKPDLRRMIINWMES